MYEDDMSQIHFLLVISITLSLQTLKIQIPKILSIWVFEAQKFRHNFEILLLIWTLTPNKLGRKCLRFLIFAQTIAFNPYFMKITTLISTWLQLAIMVAQKLLNIFMKSISLAILSFHHKFF